jgi:hypothetical protein
MKDLKYYIIGGVALLVFYLMAQFNKPKVIDWTDTLKNTDTIPFGTYVAYRQINDIFPGAGITTKREPVYNVLHGSNYKNSTYIIICKAANLSKQDYDKLTTFIKNGNDVFIAATSFGPYLNKELGVQTQFIFNSDDAVRIGFVSKELSITQYAIEKSCTHNYFIRFDTTKAIVLGENERHLSNYLKFAMGKGNLYLNANPLMFSNYSLLQEQGAAYSATALSFVKNRGNIIWDEYYTRGREEADNDMRVFLKNPGLRWAFNIAFFGLLAFVIYETKRRQRIIPVIEPLTNTTVEFASVVGQVYYEQRNNSNIAQKKISYFLEHLRAQYNIRTNVLDDEFTQLLAQKSGADLALIRELTGQIIVLRNSKSISDSELIVLNQNIESFYKQSS